MEVLNCVKEKQCGSWSARFIKVQLIFVFTAFISSNTVHEIWRSQIQYVKLPGSEVIKLFFMVYSTEHENHTKNVGILTF